MARKIRLEYGTRDAEHRMVRILRFGTICSYVWYTSLGAILTVLYFTTTVGEFWSEGVQTVLIDHPLLIIFIATMFVGLFADGYFNSKASELANSDEVRVYEQ